MYTAVTEGKQETVIFCGAWGFPEKFRIKGLTTDSGDNQHKTVFLNTCTQNMELFFCQKKKNRQIKSWAM